MASAGCGHCHPIILTIYCASCGEHLDETEPQFPCPTWHNHEEPYCLDPAYPGPEVAARQGAGKPNGPAEDIDDTDSGKDSNESERVRDLLSSLEAMGFPKSRARTALKAISNQNLDAATDWLNDNRPLPESIPDPDPAWSRWRRVRCCFFAEMTNILARDWIRNAAVVAVKHARDGKEEKELCCKEIPQVDVIIRLIGNSALFTVRDAPIEDDVSMKDITVKSFVPVKSEQDGRRDVKTKSKAGMRGNGDMQENKELAEAMRRSLTV